MTTDSASVIESGWIEENNDKCWTSFSILRTQTKVNIIETSSINLTNILHVFTLTSESVLKSSGISLALLYGSIFARKSLSCYIINDPYFEIRSNIDQIWDILKSHISSQYCQRYIAPRINIHFCVYFKRIRLIKCNCNCGTFNCH